MESGDDKPKKAEVKKDNRVKKEEKPVVLKKVAGRRKKKSRNRRLLRPPRPRRGYSLHTNVPRTIAPAQSDRPRMSGPQRQDSDGPNSGQPGISNARTEPRTNSGNEQPRPENEESR